MTLRFRCPHCDRPKTITVAANQDVCCTDCDWQRHVPPTEIDGGRPAYCLICGNGDLWRQKDFPQSIGLTMVAAGAILSSIAWYFHRPVWALGILLAFAAADLLLFALMPDVLVCYRCSARHSGGDLGEHPAFNHETAERYRQERLRLEEAAHAHQ